jgi:hypothetical protein
MQMENRARTAVSTQANKRPSDVMQTSRRKAGFLRVVRSPMKSIRIARPISGRRKSQRLKAGVFGASYRPG